MVPTRRSLVSLLQRYRVVQTETPPHRAVPRRDRRRRSDGVLAGVGDYPSNPAYPPGCNRRVIDWVRSPRVRDYCVDLACTLDAEVRQTDLGPCCLVHYLLRPTCEHEGCHRPQLDPKRGKRYRGIYLCTLHARAEHQDECEAEWDDWLRYGRCWTPMDQAASFSD